MRLPLRAATRGVFPRNRRPAKRLSRRLDEHYQQQLGIGEVCNSPTSGMYRGLSNAVQVLVSQTQPTYFMRPARLIA